ncbi:Coiled-coil domain-containing protein 55 (DUF2040) [Geosmithia morbida]|uniref:Coiled-coil domain-containing protein 55 (DUF2040) n=1 Tax=Geosmithia morbida TaxID=1094350 RepID=A0A9P4YT42_9HYPO|nr:Coiled-coil domain-containing protein 55 (DUF2040) [Geosmithia morbida]KAF4121228.1 Coiled-coil domain-containing protein 55 (DUF2040) [Geosmithia morbida]
MSKPLSFGLNLTKKPSQTKKTAPPRRKPMFGADDDSDDDGASGDKDGGAAQIQEVGGDDLDDVVTTAVPQEPALSSRRPCKPKSSAPSQPPKSKAKGQPNLMFGDLSSSLTSRKNAEAAAKVDASVYEYDNVYDSLKPKKPTAQADKDRRPRYMRGLLDAAEVRKRDALIAEEKKIARDREAEGEEFQDKEKFVTEAYRKQQEENKRLEEEEKKREEAETKKNQAGGMSGFYRNLLNKDEQRHSEAVKAAEEAAANGGKHDSNKDDEEAAPPEHNEETRRVNELKEKGADIAINEEGQVVDKRQLLRGGLNLSAKRKDPGAQKDSSTRPPDIRERKPAAGGPNVGSKQAMRERQSRMLAEQLEQSTKRSREEADAQREEAERAAKSRKTEGEIMSAKERYLARKRAAEEEKKKAR